MTLIVEDGTGRSDAESYASVDFTDAYHLARGNTLWATLNATEKEQALRRATEFMGESYRLRWAGYRTTDAQALDWPRYEVPRKDGPGGYASCPSYYDSQSVPDEVTRACAALAFKAAGGDLAPDLGQAVKRKKVGPIEIEYADYSPQTKRYRSIDMILAPLMKGSGGLSISLVRA